MLLKELLHTTQAEKIKGLVNIDDWKFQDVDHLTAMGFDFDGDFAMAMEAPPMKVYKKKHPKGEFFYLEEDGKGIKVFKNFDQMVEYFDHYSQPEIDKEIN